MMTETLAVEVSRRIAAAPEAVFDAWLDPASARQWLFATQDGVMEKCEIDARVGGRFVIVERRGDEHAEHHGEFVALERPRRIAFDFWTSFGEERTRVTVTIAPDGNGSQVTLRHDGVWVGYEERTREGWAKVLARLAETVE